MTAYDGEAGKLRRRFESGNNFLFVLRMAVGLFDTTLLVGVVIGEIICLREEIESRKLISCLVLGRTASKKGKFLDLFTPDYLALVRRSLFGESFSMRSITFLFNDVVGVNIFLAFFKLTMNVQ